MTGIPHIYREVVELRRERRRPATFTRLAASFLACVGLFTVLCFGAIVAATILGGN